MDSKDVFKYESYFKISKDKSLKFVPNEKIKEE